MCCLSQSRCVGAIKSAIECRVLFFFQAEDGIRDLVRSRGLGDVYKRQVVDFDGRLVQAGWGEGWCLVGDDDGPATALGLQSVSYTHLTLPTSDLV